MTIMIVKMLMLSNFFARTRLSVGFAKSMPLLFAGVCAIAQASPTANEYEHCERMGAALLAACLKEGGTSSDARCKSTAEPQVSACYEQVKRSHDREFLKERADAMKRAEDKKRGERGP